MSIGRTSFIAALLVAVSWSGARGDEPVRFNRDIRPILSDACFACHGPDRNTRKSDLRLDTAQGAARIKDGKQAVVPGHPELSELLRRIKSSDPDDAMPPAKTGKRISAAQVGLLERWIAEGARFEPHWSFQPVTRPPLPEGSPGSDPLHPVDRFLASRLEREGLKFSPEADRRTLIRRLSFDLTGLPPHADDVDRFVSSRDPRAYEKLVGRLLDSPHFGERMALPWLDLVRYADTIGYHGDVPYSVWPYRDYVIRSFNRNVPFDQFTREQIAGDLLQDATPSQLTASAYNRLLRISTEGGVQDKEFLAKYASDRVRTTATVWMGMTLACAECHDHKFDPLTTRDFYRFSAFFSDLKEKGFYDKGFSENDWGSKIRLATPAQNAALMVASNRIALAQVAIDRVKDSSLERDRLAWEERMLALDRLGLLRWTNQIPLRAESAHGATLTIGEAQSVTASGHSPDRDVYSVAFRPGPGVWHALRLETLVDEIFPGNRIARGGITFVVTDFKLGSHEPGQDRETRIAFAHVSSDMQGEGHPALAMIDEDLASGWAITTGHSREHQAAFRFARPLVTGPRTELNVRIAQESNWRRATIGKFRLSLSSLPRPTHEKSTLPDAVLNAIKADAKDRKEDQHEAIAAYYRKVAPELEPLQWKLARLNAELGQMLASIPTTLVSEALSKPRQTRVLPRGNWMDDSGEAVQPGYPEFLDGSASDGFHRRATREDLARWLVSKDNPMTSRAFVNRLWRQFFGAGFTRTPEDLGTQGDWPSHPELLDWLAHEFMEPAYFIDGVPGADRPHAWDIKHLVRILVTSRAYRQSSAPRPDAAERDPENRLLARQNRLRLDAELIRDNALAISGLLSRKVGGASVFPHQPEGYYSALNFPKREYAPSWSGELYRRGLYTHWQRTFLHPALLAFDAPSREECTVARTASNTPLQALVLLNEPTQVEAARALALQMAAGPGSVGERMAKGWKQVTGRPPNATETRILMNLLEQEQPSAGLAPGTSREPRAKTREVDTAAWMPVARALLNLHETITRP